MRGVVSLVVAGVVGSALWVGLSPRESEAKVEHLAPVMPFTDPELAGLALEPEPQPLSDSERRAALNARLHTMIRDGRGARLEDAAVRLPRTSRSAQAANPSAARSGYRAPRLDLTTAPNIPDNDLDCLSQAIYYEARNESEAGQTAVAEVVMNRVRHPGYPNRVCDVVYQRNSRTCQFTFTCDGSIGRGAMRQAAWARAQRIAGDVLQGRHQGQLPDSSVNYHADYVRPTWGQRLARVRQIGTHIFYGQSLNADATPGAAQTQAQMSKAA